MRILLSFFLFFSLAYALVIIDSALALSCVYYMKGFDWGCGGSGQGHKMYMCRCANVEWLGSVSSCIATQGSNPGQIEHAWAHVALRCKQKGGYDYDAQDMRDWAGNATSYLVMPTEQDYTVQVTRPLAVNETAYEYYKRSFNQMNHHVFKTQWFGWGLIFFWAMIMTVFTVANVAWRLLRWNIYGKLMAQVYQKHLSPTTKLFGLSRLNVILFAAHTIQTVLSTALSYSVELPNAYINDSYLLTLDLIGYRLGIIAFSLMPLVFIFGLRNNPLCFLTGLSQAQFITYHKFVAIVMCIEALVHSAVWTAYAMKSGPYSAWSIDDYWRWGVVGTVILFLMLGQSIRAVRTLMYETFLLAHKILGWLFIVAMWYHCYILGWMGWVYAMIALTVYDRTVVFVKTFVVNRGYTNVTVSVVDDKVLKITIPKPLAYDAVYKPGSQIYLSFYHWSIWYQCWQLHPFSVTLSPVMSPNVLVIYVRIKKGTTRLLANLKTDEKGRVDIFALIDGPYGQGAHSYTAEDTVVGVAGGMGICGIIQNFYRVPAQSKLFWVVNNFNEVQMLSRDLSYLVKRGVDVHVVLKGCENESAEMHLKNYPYLSISRERPSLGAWVEESVEFAKFNGSQNLFVLTCGNGLMDNTISNEVAKRVQIGLQLMIHHQQEYFVW